MKKFVALLVGLTFALGSVSFAVAAGEKGGKKDNATANATTQDAKKKKKKVEGC